MADGFAWTPALRAGDDEALAELLAQHRERLRRFVVLRCDARLQGRSDADDVLQEAFLAARTRRASLSTSEANNPFVWLRGLVGQTLIDVHRRHLGVAGRAASREVPMLATAAAGSTAGESQLAVSQTSPSQAAVRAESSAGLLAALDRLRAADREVLLLRHFEELGNDQVAALLGVSRTAASNRYVRALERLREVMGGDTDGDR